MSWVCIFIGYVISKGAPGTHDHLSAKSFSFSYSFKENCPNNGLERHLWGWRPRPPPPPDWEILDQPLILLPPAHEVCEGYVFTRVCLSTGGSAWGSACSRGRGTCSWGECLLQGRGCGDPPRSATAAGGTHPTGMHSCYFCHKNTCK